MKYKLLAIILARSGSKRIKNKNCKYILGKPMIVRTIEKIKNTKIFDKCILSTDSRKIMNIVKKYKFIEIHKRSKINSSNNATTADALIECLNYKRFKKKYRYCCVFYGTSIFINPKDIISGYKNLIKNSLSSFFQITETEIQKNKILEIDSKKKKIRFNKDFNNNYKKEFKYYKDTGQFYWIKIKDFMKYKKILMKNSGYQTIPNSKSHDINNYFDLEIAKIKLKNFKI